MDQFNLKKIFEIDSDLKQVSDFDLANIFVKTISSFDEVNPGSLVFFKDKRVWNQFKKLELIIPESIVALVQEENSSEFLEEVKEKFSLICSFKSFELSIHKLSKFFWLEKQKNYNDIVDGRKIGTTQIHPTADISENVFLGQGVVIEENVQIYPGVRVLSHSKIGAGTIIYPNSVVYQDTVIGKNCIIHGNSTIGGDGFGFEFFQGQHLKVYHLGNVVMGDNIEVGVSVGIDRGTFKTTFIDDGCKFDNHVQVAHNCQVGKNVIMCGQSGLSGSARVGNYVVIGGKAGIGPGVEVGDTAQIAGAAMVTGNAAPGEQLAGHPARPLKEWLKGVAAVRKLIKK